MNYGELLHQVSFEDVIPYFKGEEAEHLADYKMHFDMLRKLEPQALEAEADAKTIEIGKDDEGEIYALDELHFCPWQHALTLEISVQEGVEAKTEEIAAACLVNSSSEVFVPDFLDIPQTSRWDWSTLDCYYLFNPLKKKYGKYIRKDQVMSKPACRRLARHRAMKLIEIRAPFSKENIWRTQRNWVYTHKVSYLASLVDYVLCKGTNTTPTPSARQLCDMVLASRYDHCSTMWSFACDAQGRTTYIKELVEKYNALDHERLDNVMLCVTTSAAYPLQPQEQETIAALFGANCHNVTFIAKTDDSMDNQLRIDYAFYE